jgi:glycosyltransferase involved in cell wall biosynthesis
MPLRVVIIGDRGIPARYSGFSTLVEQLAVRLVRDHAMDVTVYCRNHYYKERPATWQGVHCVYLPAPGGKSFESIVHSNLAMAHAATQGFDVAFIVDPGNAPFLAPLAAARVPTVFHTDGIGWQRRKWSPLQRKYYRWSERVCARVATWLVTDSHAMQDYYQTNYSAPSSFIPYSGEVGDPPSSDALKRFDLQHDGYYLAVARMEPENNLDLIVREHLQSSTKRPLVVVGSTPFPTNYSRALMAQSDDRVRMVGGIYDSATLNALYRHCAAYFHGHEVGGTNPSLLRAMHWGAPCIPIDVVFHREVLGHDVPAFNAKPGDLARLIDDLDGDQARRAKLGRAARERSDTAYRWDAVADAYANLFCDVADQRSRSKARAALGDRIYYQPEQFAPVDEPLATIAV